MAKVLILKPRMDVMFKQSMITSVRTPIPPIRLHWLNFISNCEKGHKRRGDDVAVIELPLWQFKPKMVEEIKPDIVYVPHKESHNFPIKNCEVRYFMQTVFPWRFYVDSKGFAGGSTLYPMNIDDGNEHGPWFEKLRTYALSGKSKFDQPKSGWTSNEPYVLFPCQIPHDETIKHHSNVTVEQALEKTCEVTKELGIKLIVKGHPINPGSMENLKNIATKYGHTEWIDNVSIHDLLKFSKLVVVVNSGTGMEALLHNKPVVTFGRCEYDVVTMKADLISEGLKDYIMNPLFDEVKVKKFFDKWCSLTYDSNIDSDFHKLG